MAWYDTGTVSVTNGSTAVTGSGTNFVAGAQVGEGFYGPDGRLYEIQAIVSATSLTLADAYLGTTQTGQEYKIVPTQSLVADLASQVSTLISDYQSVADNAGEGKFQDGSATSPGITFTLDQDTGFFRDTANEIGVAVAGVKKAEFNSTGIDVTGTITADSGYFQGSNSFINDTMTLNFAAPNGQVAVKNSSGSPAANLYFYTTDTLGNTNLRQGISYEGDISFYEGTGTTPKFFWDASAESLGIGTSSPSERLDIEVSGASSAGISLNQTGTGGRDYRIASTGSGYGSTGNLIIYDATAGSERMRIDSSGNVGIGDSTTNYQTSGRTTVNIGGNDQVLLGLRTTTDNTGYIYGSASNMLFEAESGRDVGITAIGANNIILKTTNTERMRIDASGNVGIGTSSPEDRLDLGSGNIRFKNSLGSTGDYGSIKAFNSAAPTNPATNIRFIRDIAFYGNDGAICFDTVNTERMRIDSSGNVGIGFTPSAWRTTEKVIQMPDGAFYTGNNYVAMGQNYYIPSVGGSVYIESDFASDYYQQDGTHVWRRAGSGTAGAGVTWSESMRIDASGNLLVGNTVTNPASGFSAQKGFGYAGATGVVEIATTADASTMQLGRNNANDGKILVFRKQGTEVGSIGSRLGANIVITAPTATYFDSSIRPLSDNSKAIGTSTLRFTDLYLSGGVYLGGTGAANKLDDYEEGTWTPDVVGTATAGTGTYAVRTGKYTKVGNLVTVFGSYDLTAHTGSGDLRIDGLPFTAANEGNLYTIGQWSSNNLTLDASAVQVYVFSALNTTYLTVSQLRDGASNLPVVLDATHIAWFSISYYV